MAERVDLAEVLRRYGPAYRATHTLSPARERVWRALVACRTPALGGQVETCPACGASRFVYHSCRNRHCPQCQTRAKEAWLAARRREVLPVPYFHLVFTLPHDLNGLIGQAPRRLYETLFGAVSATLTEFAADPRWLGGTAAFSLVLHTWKQDLGRHVHLHALVAGGALSAEGAWLPARPGFLFPVRALSRLFRGKFVAALAARFAAGELGEAVAWGNLRQKLFAQDWVVYAKAPVGGPAQVLAYLSRYSHRVAISNERLVGLDGEGAQGVVRFRVRDRAHGNAKRTLSLPADTFIDRFLLHVLPKGFKRIRHYGVLGPAGKAVKLAQARAALAAPAPDPAVVESVAAFLRRIERLGWTRCRCGGMFAMTAVLAPMPERRPWPQGPP